MDAIRKLNSTLGMTIKSINEDFTDDDLNGMMDISVIDYFSTMVMVIAVLDPKMTFDEFFTIASNGKFEKRLERLTNKYTWEEIEAKATKALEKTK